MNIENLRRQYADEALGAEELHQDPIAQFTAWFDDAQSAESADWFEPNAMTLATSDLSGQVSARIVLLKNISPSGLTFFTNYQSNKARQLLENPRASLVFYWPHRERQVRIEGQVSKTDAATSDEYFHARPRESQLGAIASPQSQPLADRKTIEAETKKLASEYGDQEIPRPEYWGGYLLQPNRFEFWQGRPSRLHDRLVYTRQPDKNWTITRLAP